MNTIKSAKELEINLKTLERYKTSNDQEERDFYKKLINNGICFLVYENNDSVLFAPSRFIGYQANTKEKHLNNEMKHGNVTNGAIKILLGSDPEANIHLDYNYRIFCKNLGFVPFSKGALGNTRKFWIYNNSKVFINKLKNYTINDNTIEEDIDKIITDKTKDNTEKQSLIKTRLGQGDFRKKLLIYWKTCAVTRCDDQNLLIASHIKPWALCNNKERMDVYNGILLIPNLDRLFDRGFISFTDTGKILVSKSLSETNLTILRVDLRTSVKFDEGHNKYIKYHRENVFIE